MEITSVDVTPFVDKKLRAFATILLDGCFIVRGLKIIEGQAGLFVAMPNKRRQDGSFQDIAHPITSEFRRYMEEVVLEAYKSRDPEPAAGAGSP
jgi:stage V sporulation protein G